MESLRPIDVYLLCRKKVSQKPAAFDRRTAARSRASPRRSELGPAAVAQDPEGETSTVKCSKLETTVHSELGRMNDSEWQRDRCRLRKRPRRIQSRRRRRAARFARPSKTGSRRPLGRDSVGAQLVSQHSERDAFFLSHGGAR